MRYVLYVVSITLYEVAMIISANGVNDVPEPVSLGLIGSGMLGSAALRLWRKAH